MFGHVKVYIPGDDTPYVMPITRENVDKWSEWEDGIWRMWPDATILYGI